MHLRRATQPLQQLCITRISPFRARKNLPQPARLGQSRALTLASQQSPARSFGRVRTPPPPWAAATFTLGSKSSLSTAALCTSTPSSPAPNLPSTSQLRSGSSSSTVCASNSVPSARAVQLARHFSSSSSPTSSNPADSSFDDPSGKMSPYTVRKVAAPNTLEHRVYIEKDGQPVSPFHDIPLYANQDQTILNMIVEIPRWTNAKLEVG
jgi:inorganic pyrophosphatase